MIVIPEYIYRYKLSVAKIELMSLDLSRVEYINDKKGDSKHSSVKIDPNDEAFRLQEEANKETQARRKSSEWQKIKLSDLNTTHNNTD